MGKLKAFTGSICRVIKDFPKTTKRTTVAFMSLKSRSIDAYHKEEFHLQ